jgi:hypothetical protein
MAVHLDHFSISSPNMVYGAHRLRLESTLSFYDGGHFRTGGHANRIFPLGANTYLEINGIVDAESVRDPKGRPWWYHTECRVLCGAARSRWRRGTVVTFRVPRDSP